MPRRYASGSSQSSVPDDVKSDYFPSRTPSSEPGNAAQDEYIRVDVNFSNETTGKAIPLVTPVTNKAHISEPPPPIEEDGTLFSPVKSEALQKQSEEELKAFVLNLKQTSSKLNAYTTAHSDLDLRKRNYKYVEKNISSYENIASFSNLPLEFGYNQHISIDNDMREKLRSILWKFHAPIKYAFAYGSGVFSQGKASDASKPQVDLIFGVSYTEHWHSLNMRQNPEHYSSLSWLGSGAVSFVQDKLGSGVYFNPYVEIDGVKIKYGVVNVNTLLSDLNNWDSLYLAGRLHKPVKILRDEPRIRFVNQANLISALRTALLTLPEEFSELDLYTTLAGISYMGDPRMAFGENPHKVRNIVNSQFLNFRSLYSPILDVLPNVELRDSASFALESNPKVGVATMRQDMSPVRRGNMVVRLPHDFREKIYRRYQSKYDRVGSENEAAELVENENSHVRIGTSFDRSIANDPELAKQVSRAIKSTVYWPSFSQSCKGVLTAGVGRSVKYALEKISKARSAKKA